MGETKVLDHGYIKLIETWGSDERIIEAARQSTNKGFLGWGTKENPGDEKLLRYLYTHGHMTPFEMAGAIFEVKAPIFVFREWQRHRTMSYNEMSARYTPLPDENYVPTKERVMLNSNGTNKQANRLQGAEEVSYSEAEKFIGKLDGLYDDLEEEYTYALTSGVPKELARLSMSVGHYSKMRVSANLRNWMGFLKLRMSEDAQWEIRQYANEVCQVMLLHFERSMTLFCEGL